MAKLKYGLELGIKAQREHVIDAYKKASSAGLDYFFVPETHDVKYGGVDALSVISSMADMGGKPVMGTGIVSVFSRREDSKLYGISKDIANRSEDRFVLGIGPSTPYLAKLHGKKLENPIARMREVTKEAKERGITSVYWAATGDKMLQAAASDIEYKVGIEGVRTERKVHADGVFLFMGGADETKRRVGIVKENLLKSNIDPKKYNIVWIVPTYVESGAYEWRESASATIARYLVGNEKYRPGVRNSGLGEDLEKVLVFWHENKLNFRDEASMVKAVSENVSDKMIDALTVHGSPDECSEKLKDLGKKAGVNTIVPGIDLWDWRAYQDPYYQKDLAGLLQSLV
jgi:hypothetical protein